MGKRRKQSRPTPGRFTVHVPSVGANVMEGEAYIVRHSTERKTNFNIEEARVNQPGIKLLPVVTASVDYGEDAEVMEVRTDRDIDITMQATPKWLKPLKKSIKRGEAHRYIGGKPGTVYERYAILRKVPRRAVIKGNNTLLAAQDGRSREFESLEEAANYAAKQVKGRQICFFKEHQRNLADEIVKFGTRYWK
jgi:hypothetical protein